MRTFRLRRQLTSERELARVGLVLGPEAARQAQRHARAAQHAALRVCWLRRLVVGLFVVALVEWLWSLCHPGGGR